MRNEVSLGADTVETSDSSDSDSEVNQSEEDQYVVAPVDKGQPEEVNIMVDEEIMSKLVMEGILSKSGVDTYTRNKQKLLLHPTMVVECDKADEDASGSSSGKRQMKLSCFGVPHPREKVKKLNQVAKGDASFSRLKISNKLLISSCKILLRIK